MEYILLHKELPVLSFELDDDLYVTQINEIFDEKHVPIGLLNNSSESPVSALRSWWKNRAIPASRQYLRETLELLRIKNSSELLSKCHGLSLSDHYWVKNLKDSEYNLKWKDINFFENNFSDDIGEILTGNFGIQDIDSISFLSPDGSTDGWLPKKWLIENEQRILLKGGSETYQQEPFNEVIASEICSKLNINHTTYTLRKHENTKGLFFYSSCPDIVSTDTELIPAYSLFKTEKPDNNTDSLSLLFRACKKSGIKNIETLKSEFSKIGVLDFIIANTDRHMNNFGFLRNPDTLEWIGLAPVYDSGTSLFCKQSPADLRNPSKHDSEYVETKPFAKTLRKQFDRILKVCGKPKLDFSALTEISNTFTNLLDQNPQNEGRSEFLGTILESRIEETYRILNNEIKHHIHQKSSSWDWN